MTPAFDFVHPWVLALLPLALLPLLRRRGDTLPFAHAAWLPPQRIGSAIGLLWRGLAVLALAGIIVGLASPGRAQTQLARTGHGMEILILLDRSGSMNSAIVAQGEQAALRTQGNTKADAARELLMRFVEQRPDDRYAFVMFSTSPLRVLPFTERKQAILAGIAATGIGRGLMNTDIGRAMLAAIGEFDGRPYSGSRIIMLVSDGGAQLDAGTRKRIETGLARNRIALYWIYLRTGNGPSLRTEAPDDGSAQEIALHRFFQGLGTPYRAYEAEDASAMAAAIAAVGRQQNLPLSFMERVPRKDDSRHFFGMALVCCGLLLCCRGLQLRSWT
ncbi:vWA domain-containing protein [Verminephrobacter eiseniae]|uniref:vWA domain-containing protein n=1 Tax=Verminephrobacter eiseniae TaxID=364317 RepID=UPI00223842BC|nr:vWA domain-containing protein [Verminephrobacter eiseniae]MCW5238089.1 VWA domain-containing protein [Verminephrobacter eiseniae]